ncbi:MAG: aminotransferase class V-fold PLP-dependent enzyme [Planctomycetes bacterium]|nr:aminotransferase class V-fold PLP-dependent enzyme [Planctomycetota bacterium]MCP4771292.1 aminotransferase class V-fold PLP-dependent enzyme [Planctomycetota bacterium]MCP4860475.1 aminotransferase class V-fold PLP-dependent enzyme [Planctomycetota bacterium]
MDQLLTEILDIAQELLDDEETSAPMPRITPDEMRQRVDLSLQKTGLPTDQVLERMRLVVRNTPRTSNRRFYNQLFAGRQVLSSAAEMLTGLLNVSMYTYKIAGPMILIEDEVLTRMCRFAGFPEGEGISVPGGSMANLVGMMLARNRAMPGIRENGSDGRPLTYYVSELGHYSVSKNTGILGTGRANLRKIAVDEMGRMCVDALAAAIEKDLADGAVPCAVIATMGTTVLGEFDPLREIAAVTKKYGIWLHADGAYGGTMLLNSEGRKLLDGLELADSLTWDAHKTMGIPLMCSMLLTRERGLLRADLNEAADYLFQADDDLLNPGTRSLQCGRRNDAFKLWAAWLGLGDEGWEKRTAKQLHHAKYAAARINREEKMTLCQEPASSNICFKVEGADAAEVCGKLHESGQALIGYGVVRGEEVFRLVTVNPHIEEVDLDRLFDEILAASGF